MRGPASPAPAAAGQRKAPDTRKRVLLMERIWGYDSELDARSIDAHIRRLRLKLGAARDHVETVVGLGYRFVKQPGPARPERS